MVGISGSSDTNFVNQPTVIPTQRGTQPLDPKEVEALYSPAQDNIQTQTTQGSAQTSTSFFQQAANNPGTQQVRTLINSQKYDEAFDYLEPLNRNQLQNLRLQKLDIARLAAGLASTSTLSGLASFVGAGSLVGNYSDDEKQLINELIDASPLSPDDKISLKMAYTDTEVQLLQYVQNTTIDNMRDMSSSNRAELLAKLDSKGWGWATELFTRRILKSERDVDKQVVRLLQSADTEQEVLKLLESLQSFNQDDIAHMYVKAMKRYQPEKLFGFSDETKIKMIQMMVESTMSGVDFASLKLNDALLVSDEHAESAAILIESLSVRGRQDERVVQVQASSSKLTSALDSLNDKLKSGQIDLRTIGHAKAELASLEETHGATSEITAMKDKLDALQDQLNTARRLDLYIDHSIERASDSLEVLNQEVDDLAKDIPETARLLAQAEVEMTTKRQEFDNKLQQVYSIAEQIKELAPELETALNELAQSQGDEEQMASFAILSEQISKLAGENNQAGSRLNQLVASFDTLSDSLNTIHEDFSDKISAVQGLRYNLEQDRTKLANHVASFETTLGQLKSAYADANNQYGRLSTSMEGIDKTRDLRQIKLVLDQSRGEIGGYESALSNAKDKLRDLNIEAQMVEATYESMSEAIDKIQVQSQATVERVEKEQAFMVAANSQAQEVYTSNQTNLSDLQSIIQDIKSNKDNIKDVAQIDSTLERLKSIKENLGTIGTGDLDKVAEMEKEIDRISSYLIEVKGFINESTSTLADLDSDLGRYRREETQIRQAIDQSIQSIDETRGFISQTETEIAEIQSIIQDDQAQLVQKQNQASQLNQQWDSIKSRIRELKSNPQELHNFQSELQTLEAEQNTIMAQLDDLQGVSSSLTTRIDSNVKSLETKKNDLLLKKANLEEIYCSLEDKVTELNDIKTRSLELSNRLDTFIEKLPDSQALDGQKSLLVSEKNKLEQKIAEVEERITATQVEMQDPLSKQDGEILQTVQSLESTIEELKGLSSTVEVANQQISQLKGDYQVLKAQKDSLQHEVENVLNGVTSLEEGLERIEEIERREQSGTLLLSSESYQLLQNTKAKIEAAIELMEHGSDRVNANASLREALELANAEGKTKISSIRQGISALESQVNVMEQNVSRTRDQMLQIKQELLQSRKNLGISNQGYQDLLMAYEETLTTGDPMSPEFNQKIQWLENALHEAETKLAYQNYNLVDGVNRLQDLKFQVNQKVDELDGYLSSLVTLKEDLSEKTKLLEPSVSQLEEIHQKANLSIQELEQLLVEVEAANINGQFSKLTEEAKNLREQIAELKQFSASVSQEIQSSKVVMAETKGLVEEIDSLIERAQNLREKLIILKIEIDELADFAEKLENSIQSLLDFLDSMSSDFDQFQAGINSNEDRREQLRTVKNIVEPDNASEIDNEIEEESFGRFTQFGLNNLPSVDSTPSNDQGHERRWRQSKEEFQSTLSRLIQNSEEQREELKEFIQQEVEMELYIQHILQQAYSGQSNTTGVHIMGVENIVNSNA